MRRSTATLLLATTLLAACGDGSDPIGGIAGRVLAGPSCPVETLGSPCPPTPWEGIVRATNADGETFETRTDPEGAYTLALPPDTYVVVAVTGPSAPPTGIPAEVTVTQGPPRRLDLEVDTGIR